MWLQHAWAIDICEIQNITLILLYKIGIFTHQFKQEEEYIRAFYRLEFAMLVFLLFCNMHDKKYVQFSLIIIENNKGYKLLLM